jgi:hypothetical protein
MLFYLIKFKMQHFFFSFLMNPVFKLPPLSFFPITLQTCEGSKWENVVFRI